MSTLIPYDDIPYPSYAFQQTHPDRLATVAALLGLSPAPVVQCRVLELGCASGGNLIPMAYALPQSSFVGIDLSQRQVADGQAAVSRLGLTNLDLRHGDITQLGDELGTFDYIIAHGVYSWVPPHVRDALLTLCRTHLAPHGVAYISYNTLPGWSTLLPLRDVLRYRTRDAKTAEERLAMAYDLLERFATLAEDPSLPQSHILVACRSFLERQAGRTSLEGKSYTYHDILAEVNDPCLFTQFAAHAAEHGLQYLAEADFHTVLPGNFAQPVAEELAALASDLIEMEQYMDFVRGRMFRRTLLCHAEAPVRRGLRPDRVMSLLSASRAVPVSPKPDMAQGAVEQFRAPNGSTLSTNQAVSKVALGVLAERWPAPVAFGELLDAARARLESDGERERDALALASDLLAGYCYSAGLVELYSHTPPVASSVGERPLASLVVRSQAERDDIVANLRHECVPLDELQQALLPLLDGTRDREALADALAAMVADGRLSLGEAPEGEEGDVRARLERGLEELLAGLAQSALLVSERSHSVHL
ncbi:MAG: hypothetical protein RLZZ387_2985 [Chloroflexota bacterium]